jgi:hypothetical protein
VDDDGEISPEKAQWMLEAPKLVIVDGVRFVVNLVTDRETQSIERVLESPAFVRYEIRGSVGETETLHWLDTAMGDFICDPAHDPPSDVTAKAEEAFAMWLPCSHES